MSFRTALTLLWAAIAVPSGLAAQPAVLLSDIRTAPDPFPGAFGRGFIAASGVYYFQGCDDIHGCELWRSDGTAAGTRMVKDLIPGPRGGAVAPPGAELTFVESNGLLFFTAWTEPTGLELWRSDGTGQGTTLLKDIRPGEADSLVRDLVAGGGRAFFTADDGSHGRELWTSDGTPSGTLLVKDLRAGAEDSLIQSLAARGGEVFFVTHEGLQLRLWKSDGTAVGTVPVPGTVTTHPHGPLCLTTVGAGVFYFEVGPSLIIDLWRTDGTAAGTRLVTRVPEASISCTTGMLGGVFLFDANGLWRSNGTAAGTYQLISLSRAFGPFVEVNGAAFFGAGDAHGQELWRTDGTEAGTALVKDIHPGPDSSFIGNYVAAGNQVFFRASDGTHGAELWRSDGTEGGTHLVRDLQPGVSAGIVPFSPMGAVGSTVLFGGDDGIEGPELWRSDGSPEGTVRMTDRVAGSSSPSRAAWLNGAWHFFADDGVNGRELWRSDGTPGAAVLVGDIRPGRPGQLPWAEPVALQGSLYFGADDGTHGQEPWTSDGTPAGTGLLKELLPPDYPPELSSSPTGFIELGGAVHFAAYPGPFFERALWKTDGTSSGTVPIHPIPVPPFSPRTPEFLFRLGPFLLYDVVTPPCLTSVCFGRTLYRTDGSPEGVRAVADQVGSRALVLVDDHAFFVKLQGDSAGLWKMDGASAGPVLVRSLYMSTPSPPDIPELPNGLTALKGSLLFAAEDSALGRELWVSDGTEAGTMLLRDIQPGTGGSAPRDLVQVGEHVYFTADDGVSGRELWRTDGTAEGTHRVADIVPGPASSAPWLLTASNGQVFFVADDGLHGSELWRSDGSETVLVHDFNPGPPSSSFANFTPSPGGLFFSADDGMHGAEPWLIPAGALPPAISIGDVRILEEHTGTTNVSLAVDLSAPVAGMVTVQYASADGTATAGSDYQPVSGTLAFLPGETHKVIAVPVLGDGVREGDETFRVRLSSASGAGLDDGEATATIREDDDPPVIDKFWVSPVVRSGPGAVTLTWLTRRADAVTISGLGTFGPFGSVTASGATTTTFTLTATGSGGTATARVTVRIPAGIVVALPAPEIVAPHPGQIIGVHGVSFQWKAVDGAAGYGLLILQPDTGATVFSGALTGANATATLITVPEGRWLFAVRACTASGYTDDACGAFGSVGLSVDTYPPATEVTITSPQPGTVLHTSTQTLAWETGFYPLTPEGYYEVLLTDLATGTPALHIAVRVPDTSTIFTVPSSSYELKVRACLTACGAFSTPLRFSVTLAPVPANAPAVTVAPP